MVCLVCWSRCLEHQSHPHPTGATDENSRLSSQFWDSLGIGWFTRVVETRFEAVNESNQNVARLLVSVLLFKLSPSFDGYRRN